MANFPNIQTSLVVVVWPIIQITWFPVMLSQHSITSGAITQYFPIAGFPFSHSHTISALMDIPLKYSIKAFPHFHFLGIPILPTPLNFHLISHKYQHQHSITFWSYRSQRMKRKHKKKYKINSIICLIHPQTTHPLAILPSSVIHPSLGTAIKK